MIKKEEDTIGYRDLLGNYTTKTLKEGDPDSLSHWDLFNKYNQHFLEKKGQEWKYLMITDGFNDKQAIGRTMDDKRLYLFNVREHIDSGEYLVLSGSELSQLNGIFGPVSQSSTEKK